MKHALVALVALVAGCGKTVPHGGVVREPSAATEGAEGRSPEGRITTVTTATELMPADLDLVVRVDLAKVRSDLGKQASIELMDEALDKSGVHGAAREMLAEADVVWVGLRVSDFEYGDHVMVVTRSKRAKATPEAEQTPATAISTPDPTDWDESATGVAAIRRFVAKAPPRRTGTARIYTFGETAAVFVSPVEEHSVERLLKKGPDPERGDPRARGLVSLDLHAPQLAPTLTAKLPALATLIASIIRMRATVDLLGDQLELEGTIRCRDATAASKIETYLATFASPNTRFAELLAALEIARTGASVSVRWRLPQAVIAELLRSDS